MTEQKQYRFGIDAGGTKVAYGLFDQEGTLIDREEHPSRRTDDGQAFADRMIGTVKEMAARNGLSGEQILGVGVGMPSYIIYDKGYIYLTSALENVKDFYLRDYMSEQLSLPVLLDNDSNIAALAEYRKGAGRGEKHRVYIAVSTGIGSGIIITGELFRGSYGFAGEAGHMIATPDDGLYCGCGNRGCFMSWASGQNVPRHARIRMEQGLDGGRKSLLEQTDPEKLSGVEILDACRKGDPLALELLDQMAKYIGVCVYNVYELLNIKTFVFGGGLTAFGDLLFDRVREVFDGYNHIKDFPVEFRFAELKKDFGIIGAAELLV